MVFQIPINYVSGTASSFRVLDLNKSIVKACADVPRRLK